MTKQDILDYFSLIDYAYNESGRLESLSQMLDELLKEQDERIRQLESMNVTASGNGTAIGVVKGGLVIGKQTAKEIHNIKHVEVMNL